ncbi:MAG: hypothetical protein ACI4EA_11275 [Candidatus Ornithomonoglobus sp.]
MISKKATIIISVCAGAALIAGGMYGIYRHFVTPEKIVALSLINAKNDAEKTFKYFDDDEKEIFEDFLDDGGKLEADFTVSDSAVLSGMSFSVRSNSDGKCTISEIGLENGMTLEAYKDRERLYVNMPIFSGGFEIPVADFAEKWNASIFKDIVTIPESNPVKAYKLIDDKKENIVRNIYSQASEVTDIRDTFNISEAGGAKVIVNGKTKQAKEYEMYLTKACYDGLTDIFIESISGNPEDEKTVEYIKSVLQKNTEDNVIRLRLIGTQLREIETEGVTSNTKNTIAFRGAGNPFDEIIYYKNDDVQNAVRRVHNSSSGRLSENIYFGESGSLTFEEGSSMIKAKLSLDGWNASFNAYGKKVTDDKVAYDNAELAVDGICTLSGSFSVSDEYDRDFSFNKSGQYVNLLEIGQDEWEAVTDTLLKGISILGL